MEENEKVIVWNAADGTQQEIALDDINARFEMANAFDVVENTSGKKFYLFDDNPLDVVEYDNDNGVKRFVIITDITTSNIKDFKKKLQKMDDLTEFDNYQQIIYK